MPATVADLVQQTSSTTGTGNFTLSAVSGRRSFFDAFGTGGTDVFYYYLTSKTSADFELGTGHLSNSATLVRDTVLLSSNANDKVNFPAGNKDVICDVPASFQQQLLDLSATILAAVADAVEDLTTDDIAEATNKNYVSDAELVKIGNLSGTNTGDQTSATLPLTSRTITAAGTATLASTDTYLGINKTVAANTDVTLSDAARATGRIFEIKDEKPDAGTHRIRLTPESGTIEGQSFYDINTDRDSARLKGNGTEWKLL